eukprot:1143964-Prorocentrum_minimum.AAC.1
MSTDGRKEGNRIPRRGISCIFQTPRSEPQWIVIASPRVTIQSHVFHNLRREKVKRRRELKRELERARMQTWRWKEHKRFCSTEDDNYP